MQKLVRKVFAYSKWANRELLNTVPHEHGEALRLMSHLVAAEQVWLSRVRGEQTADVQIWPNWEWDVCQEQAEAVGQAWLEFAEGLSAEAMDHKIQYRNSRGEGHETPLRDVLLHVATHSAYHRGQVAEAVKQAGGEPTDTGYILFQRMQLSE